MPVIEVHLIEGYESDAKRRLSCALTDATRLVVPAPTDAITVMLHEHAADSYMRGRTSRAPAPALPDAAEIVRSYLAAMEARDLTAAESLLGSGFEMTFPGTAPMTSLQELIDWAKPRYQHVTKTIDGMDTAAMANGTTVVFCYGTLAGAWPDGSLFSGIRFIDRFELRDGLITKQDVWNDIAEVRP